MAVRARRTQLGLSQAEVEQPYGPSELTIRKIEKDQLEGPPRLGTLRKLEKALRWKPGTCTAIINGTAGDDPDEWALPERHLVDSAPAVDTVTAGVTPAGAPGSSQVGNPELLLSARKTMPGDPLNPDHISELLKLVSQLAASTSTLRDLIRSAEIEMAEGTVTVSITENIWNRIHDADFQTPTGQQLLGALAELHSLPRTPEAQAAITSLVEMLRWRVAAESVVTVTHAEADH